MTFKKFKNFKSGHKYPFFIFYFSRLVKKVNTVLENKNQHKMYTTLLSSKAYLALSKKQVFEVLILDIEGAFDNVDPNILIKDLLDLKTSSNIIFFIQKIISHRKISFYVNKKHISDKTTYKGLPQGSVLSPILFNIYVRNIIHNIGLQFADDCAITFSHHD